MRKTLVYLACRYWFPPPGTDMTGGGRWDWQRNEHHLWLDIPSEPGEASHIVLPAPFFGYNVAYTWVLLLERRHDGRLWFQLREPQGYAYDWAEWRESALWTQFTFNPLGFPPGERSRLGDWFRGPWWFRWRTPGAEHDIMSVVVKKLDLIDQYADHPESARREIDRLRRAITLHALGGPVPQE